MHDEVLNTRLVVRDHTYVVTPAMLEAIVDYANYFRRDLERKLRDYEEEVRERELDEAEKVRRDELVASVEREIERAQLVAQDIEFLRDELQHLYHWHFDRLGEVCRKLRLQLGLEKIEMDPVALQAVNNIADFLKRENPWFRRDLFLNCINRRD